MCIRTLSATKARYTVSLQESTVMGKIKKPPTSCMLCTAKGVNM